MRPNTTLMNFRLPITLKDDFELICQQNNISMTTQLNLLIKAYNDKSSPTITSTNKQCEQTTTRASRMIAKDWSHHE